MSSPTTQARWFFATNAKIWLAAATVVVLFVAGIVAIVLTADGSDSSVGRTDGPPPAAGSAQREGGGPPMPVGQSEGWEMAFSDEFDGASLDRERWIDQSGAEADQGRGNKPNNQLEW